jgi:hypothetical protein
VHALVNAMVSRARGIASSLIVEARDAGIPIPILVLLSRMRMLIGPGPRVDKVWSFVASWIAHHSRDGDALFPSSGFFTLCGSQQCYAFYICAFLRLWGIT